MRCSECKKEVDIPDKPSWVYKKRTNGHGIYYQCSYTCWRKANYFRFAKREKIIKENIARFDRGEDEWMR